MHTGGRRRPPKTADVEVQTKMPRSGKRQSRGFSLLELVIVVVIVGIIAAIAIPRMSRGSVGAADAALAGDVAVLRNAIDLFAAEHNGANPTVANIANQLTQYTNADGEVSPTRTSTHFYGPYMRRIPPLPVGDKKGESGIAAVTGDTVGGIYDATVGAIHANAASNETDASGKAYNTY